MHNLPNSSRGTKTFAIFKIKVKYNHWTRNSCKTNKLFIHCFFISRGGKSEKICKKEVPVTLKGTGGGRIRPLQHGQLFAENRAAPVSNRSESTNGVFFSRFRYLWAKYY